MLQTKPDHILRSFSQYELNRFDRFIAGVESDERITKAWTYIRPFYKERIPEALDKDNIWRVAFGKVKFVPLRYARLLSDFTKVLEKFLLMEYISSRDTDRSIALLDIYNMRSIGSCIAPLIKSADDSLNKYRYRDGEFYLSRFRIDEQRNTYIENLDRRDDEKHLTQTMHSLDTYYLIQKLKYYASALHYQKFLNIPSEIQFMEEVMQFAASPVFDAVPLVRILLCIIQTLEDVEGEKAFEELRLLLSRHIALFPMEEAEQLYAFAVNYCIRQINKGEPEYLQKIFTLYKQMLHDGLLTYKGNISPWEFKNIVTVALRAKELKWAANFIEKQSPLIAERDRENAYTFNMARYAFAAGKYDKVLELLGTVDYDDVFYQLDAKTTLMKTYYELGEYQPLQSLKESFRILLSRKKLISDTQRDVYGNFVRYTLKLFRVDVKDKKKMDTLRKEILATKQMADKGWVMEKLEEMGG
jgi:hypothetical protein